MSNPPLVLFARVHNSGRSVAAPALTEHYSGGGVQARSATSVTNGPGALHSRCTLTFCRSMAA